MKLYGIKTESAFMLVLLFASLLIGVASAEDEKGVVRSDATAEQLSLINELYGKDITVLEYMEKVHPEHLVGVPDSYKEIMAGHKMTWWAMDPGQDNDTNDDQQALDLPFVSAPIGVASAEDEKGVIRSDATAEQLSLINELYGKDITVLEYMEKVHPEHLVGIPDSYKEIMAGHKMTWWAMDPGQDNDTNDDQQALNRATVSVSATGYKFDWRTIRFGGTCAASGLENPPWYIYVEAFLIKQDSGQIVDSISASSQQGIWSVTASKDKLYPANGQYYVHAWGYIPTPYYAENFDDTSVFSFP